MSVMDILQSPQRLFTLAAAIVSYLVLVAIYRLYFHPLANFPGSKLVALGRFYEFYYDSLSHGQFYKKIQEMHNIYGPIVRVNHRELHINDPTFYDELYNMNPQLVKDRLIVRELGMTNNVEAAIEASVHKRRRAPFQNFFSKAAIQKLEPLIHVYAEKVCGLLNEGKGKEEAVEISLLYRCFTAEVICVYCFARTYGFFDDFDRARGLLIGLVRPGDLPGVKKLGRFSDYVFIIVMAQMLLQKLWSSMGFATPGSMGAFLNFSQTLVVDAKEKVSKMRSQGTKESEDEHPTMFHKLITSDLPAEEKDDKALLESSALFLFAGFETTGFTLTLASYHLLQNTSILHRLKAEITSTWPDKDGKIPPLSELEKLPLLVAVVKESLRLGSGVLSRLPRINHHDPIKFKEYIIPAGTPISMSQPMIHYNPEIFPNPHGFNPDRWLQAKDPKQLDRYLVPFSKGARACIGQPLAFAEMYIALATVVRRFDLQSVDTTIDDIASYYDEFIPVPKNGRQRLMVKVL